jgi:TPR repeat protein
MYLSGFGVEVDYSEAMIWLLKAANQGHASAKNDIGYLYMKGYGVDVDLIKARDLFLEAIEENNLDAVYNLGYMYGYIYSHKELEHGPIIAKKLYLSAAQQGHAVSQVEMGYYNFSEVSFTIAMEWFVRAADQDDGEAMSWIGYLYEGGLGVEKDLKEAMRWYLESAKHGHIDSYDKIESICRRNSRTDECNFAEAIGLFLETADRQASRIQTIIGYLYESGRGVPGDPELAIEWYLKAVEQGYSDAACKIANLYHFGKCIPKDLPKGIEWYLRALDHGYKPAGSQLSYLCFDNTNTPDDYKGTMPWLLKAAERGIARAQIRVGYLYLHGIDVVQNYEKSLEWFEKGSHEGHHDINMLIGYQYQNGYGVGKNYQKTLEYYSKVDEKCDRIVEFRHLLKKAIDF